MMNQKTTINEGGLPTFTYADYLDMLEAQREVLVDYLTLCSESPKGCGAKEPHAYHSDDTYGDLEAALTIYHELYGHLLDSYEEVQAWFTEWLHRLFDEEIQTWPQGSLPKDIISYEDMIPPFSCDGISSKFYELWAQMTATLS